MKNVEAQAEEQRKQLYTTQINLAIEKATVLDLKAKLQKAKDTLTVAKEATKAAKATAYERGVVEIEARLTAEVTVVCKNYYVETYCKALTIEDMVSNAKATESKSRVDSKHDFHQSKTQI